ncbi:SDE2-like protein [Nymphaea thermarum]|nr:SDE2-like protein [Nymphaea thermarum]
MAISGQVFVRCFDGRSLCLQIDGHDLSGLSLRRTIHEKTLIPPSVQRLVTGTREITDEFLLKPDGSGLFPSVNLLLRLRGGKGGFGSLLRGAATKAGQKKTNNFDACRDMSGRRLRHVNAERRLEEWKAEAEERKLEKIAQEFLNKQMKKDKSKPLGVKAEKYLESYRADTSKSVEEVRAAVQESIGNLRANAKRKGLENEGQTSKRLKGLWVLEEDEDDDEDADEKSVVLDEGNAECNEAAELDDRGSPSSLSTASGLGTDGVSGSSSPCTEGVSSDCDSAQNVLTDSADHAVHRTNDFVENGSSQVAPTEQEHGASSEASVDGDTSAATPASCSCDPVDSECQHAPVTSEAAHDNLTKEDAVKESQFDEALNLDNFQTAKDFEIIGMERLKSELQARGLKCGGTLEQRAERLFLLKTMPMDKIPKKHLAKTS